MNADLRPSFFPFARAAAELRRREFARLSDTVPPRPEVLRSLTAGAFRAEVAVMLERLGYEIVTDASAADFIATKDGRKHVIACANPTEAAPTGTPALTRLHDAIVAANADAGFFITARTFTPAARNYVKATPIRLVDGAKLAASMQRSRADAVLPETYDAMCRQCGEVVQHRLDAGDARPCSSGHPVAPTIARAALVPEPGGEGAMTETPVGPAPKSRQKNLRATARSKARAHNRKARARMLRLLDAGG